jgi:hypothetical protein
MRNEFRTLLGIMVLSVFLIAGCSKTGGKALNSAVSGNQTAATQTGQVDPLKLVTRDEAVQALGEPVQPGELKDTGNPLGQKLVDFKATGSDHMLQLSVVVGTPDHDPGALFDGMRHGNPNTSYRDLAGLGDKAFSFPAGITVLKGDVVFSLTEMPVPKGQRLETLKALAVTVTQRLD